MNERILDELKKKLAVILEQFDHRARCIYVDYPVHSNIGDLLINLGSEQFFVDHQIEIWRRYNVFDFPERIQGVDKNVVFLLHGGGNFGDIWPAHQLLRMRILQQYPKNRAIFLPQTVFYRSDESERRAVDAMTRHGNLHVFVRDSESLERLTRQGFYEASLMPDMAHCLAGTLTSPPSAELDSLLLLRTDREVGAVPAIVRDSNGPAVDWNNMISYRHRAVSSCAFRLVRSGGHLGIRLNLVSLWYRTRDLVIGDAIRYLSQFETVTTNRLHGMILTLLLGRQVVWFDNSYGKLSSYVKCWLSESPNVRLEAGD